MLVNKEKYTKLIADIFEKEGLSKEDARISAEVCVENDSMGIMTHGTFRLKTYLEKIKAGGINKDAKCEITKEGPSWLLMNANHAMGHVAGYKGMQAAIAKAKKTGIAYVGISDSSHYGSNAYYALMAAKQGMIAIVCTNTLKCMAVPGSRGPVIGNSPIAYALPTKDKPTVFLDVATSNVALTKVTRAAVQGEKLPEGWIVDSKGLPTTDPNTPGYTLLPFAFHKGYGFAVMIEALAGILSGGAFLGQVCQDGMDNMPAPFNVCHAFIVIDPAQILGEGIFETKMDAACEEITSSPKAENASRIFMPGEMEMERIAKSESVGIDLPDDILARMKDLAAEYGFDINECAV